LAAGSRWTRQAQRRPPGNQQRKLEEAYGWLRTTTSFNVRDRQSERVERHGAQPGSGWIWNKIERASECRPKSVTSMDLIGRKA